MNYRDLEVWQADMRLAGSVYDLVQELPTEERFGLSDQLRRASVSIPTNIAEGRARGTTREFLRFENIASGSVAELATLLEFVRLRQFVGAEECDALLCDADRLSRQLNALRRSLESRLNSNSSPNP
jgi:four helix bundle protein